MTNVKIYLQSFLGSLNWKKVFLFLAILYVLFYFGLVRAHAMGLPATSYTCPAGEKLHEFRLTAGGDVQDSSVAICSAVGDYVRTYNKNGNLTVKYRDSQTQRIYTGGSWQSSTAEIILYNTTNYVNYYEQLVKFDCTNPSGSNTCTLNGQTQQTFNGVTLTDEQTVWEANNYTPDPNAPPGDVNNFENWLQWPIYENGDITHIVELQSGNPCYIRVGTPLALGQAQIVCDDNNGYREIIRNYNVTFTWDQVAACMSDVLNCANYVNTSTGPKYNYTAPTDDQYQELCDKVRGNYYRYIRNSTDILYTCAPRPARFAFSTIGDNIDLPIDDINNLLDDQNPADLCVATTGIQFVDQIICGITLLFNPGQKQINSLSNAINPGKIFDLLPGLHRMYDWVADSVDITRTQPPDQSITLMGSSQKVLDFGAMDTNFLSQTYLGVITGRDILGISLFTGILFPILFKKGD